MRVKTPRIYKYITEFFVFFYYFYLTKAWHVSFGGLTIFQIIFFKTKVFNFLTTKYMKPLKTKTKAQETLCPQSSQTKPFDFFAIYYYQTQTHKHLSPIHILPLSSIPNYDKVRLGAPRLGIFFMVICYLIS